MLGPHEPSVAWSGAFSVAVARRRRGATTLGPCLPQAVLFPGCQEAELSEGVVVILARVSCRKG